MTTLIPNLPEFEFKVEMDLISTPVVKLTNQSSGSQTGVDVIFKLYSPSGMPVHEGSFGAPDATGAWATYTFPETLPSFNGSIEWGQWRIVGQAKDASVTSAEYSRTFQLNPPCGWKLGQNTNYGKGTLNYTVRCDLGKVKVQDKSNYYYNGKLGVTTSEDLSFAAPADSTGVTPAPIIVSGFTAATFTIPYNGKYFHVFLDTETSNNLGENIFALIKYKDQKDFPVQCNIDLCAVACEIRSFEKKVACGTSSQDREKLIRLNTLLNLALVAKLQPGCEMDLDKILRDIIEVGNFDCKCFDNGSDGIGSAIGDPNEDASCPIEGPLTVQ